MIIEFTRRKVHFGLRLNSVSFHLTVILPHCGFQVFYLSNNMWARTIESGYKIHNKGMLDLKEGEFLPVMEECVWRDSMFDQMTRRIFL